jgi:hypothetical protein
MIGFENIVVVDLDIKNALAEDGGGRTIQDCCVGCSKPA